MKWSITKSKMFSKCQRKWFFYEIMANSRSKDSLRREAYMLKQLQSIDAWRGSIVDKVIEKHIIPIIKTNNMPSDSEVVNFSMDLMDKQLKFGMEKRYRDPKITKSSANGTFCAFYDIEYNGELNEAVLQRAKTDVITALMNLLHSNLLKEIASNNSYLIAQRPLLFQFEEEDISCTPDVFVFSESHAPLIIDWKVHSFGNTDAWLQLGTYAVALSRVSPHKDFPKNFQNQIEDLTKIRLIEYQLLRNQVREYSLLPSDIADIEDYVFKSSKQMKKMVGGKDYNELDVNQFRTAYSPGSCEKCQFKKLCWQKIVSQKTLFGD